MAHMAGNEPNFDISSKKYDVQKTVPQNYKTAWALGLKKPLKAPGIFWNFSHMINKYCYTLLHTS